MLCWIRVQIQLLVSSLWSSQKQMQLSDSREWIRLYCSKVVWWKWQHLKQLSFQRFQIWLLSYRVTHHWTRSWMQTVGLPLWTPVLDKAQILAGTRWLCQDFNLITLCYLFSFFYLQLANRTVQTDGSAGGASSADDDGQIGSLSHAELARCS